MYLPLAGINPDSDRLEKMKINSPPPISPHKLVQPAHAADPAHQRLEKIEQEAPKGKHVSLAEDHGPSQAEEHHWTPPSLSTQDFMSLREMCSTSSANNDDQFKILDEVIARIKERMELTGDMLEALQKLKEQTDPGNLALQLLTSTLEALEENSPQQKK